MFSAIVDPELLTAVRVKPCGETPYLLIWSSALVHESTFHPLQTTILIRCHYNHDELSISPFNGVHPTSPFSLSLGGNTTTTGRWGIRRSIWNQLEDHEAINGTVYAHLGSMIRLKFSAINFFRWSLRASSQPMSI